ncbi:Pao retrotransposon peptidase family protein [Ditylenchus destructor]|uniref:Pao retrotransposon peptidase family protein n=1 Tax=Ditylenchus destructor TaxID=166010 RepID=A0AAD4R885_9BILA|nr:Pao retrotransposon peptidase family protein [Ditylenchus destructor]
MELLGLLIGHRISQYIVSEIDHPIAHIHLWCDSQIVLSWLFSEKANSVFIENRIKEIKTSNAVFHYVPSHDNPADISTKGRSIIELTTEKLWWEGPAWLSKDETFWPTWNRDIIFPIDEDMQSASLVTLNNPLPTSPIYIIDENRFSSWFQVLRIIVIVLRFLCKLDKRNIDSQPVWRKILPHGMINAKELLLIIKQIQCQFCSDKDVQRFQLWASITSATCFPSAILYLLYILPFTYLASYIVSLHQSTFFMSDQKDPRLLSAELAQLFNEAQWRMLRWEEAAHNLPHKVGKQQGHPIYDHGRNLFVPRTSLCGAWQVRVM